MSIQTQIEALTLDKTNIANAIIDKGGTVNPGDGFDDFAADIGTISGGVTPTGKINITTTNEVDVTNYATAQVSDANLTAENIAKDVTILGITGTHQGGITPTGTVNITPSTSTQSIDVTAYATASVAAMPAGSYGTISATKGTVSNNSISVTPQIAAGTAGYNEMTAASGDAVTVSASELVNGNIAITNTSSVDVTNYATAQVSDANLIADNIKYGVTVLGIAGQAKGIDEVSTVPETKTTDVIKCTTDGYYYVWDEPPKLPVGGRIFYVHNDNGATYKFWDASGNELTTQTVAGLATASTYSIISGVPSADKFYVYDPTNGVQGSFSWSTDTSTATGSTNNTIGSGKTNSAIMFPIMGSTSGTIWYFVKNTMNIGYVGGCNDWYVGSCAENDQLRTSGLVDDWFNLFYMWSSVEDSSSPNSNAFCWRNGVNTWYSDSKAGTYGCFAIRSF